MVRGDLSQLTDKQKLDYQLAVCKSLRLNPLTRPFEWIWFKGGEGEKPMVLQMYATKNCTDQLRKLYGISVLQVENRVSGRFCISTARVSDKNGREDVDTGVVDGREATGQAFGDCIMWACTKAKRRATLSICGLGGMLDETEIHSLNEYRLLTPGGRIIEEQHPDAPGHSETPDEVAAKKLAAAGVEVGVVYWVWNEDTKSAWIDGDPQVISRLRAQLQPYWRSNQGRHTVDAVELEKVREIMIAGNVPFRFRRADASRPEGPEQGASGADSEAHARS